MQPFWDQQIEHERGAQIMGILKQFKPENIPSDDRTEAPLPPIPQSPYNPIPIDRTVNEAFVRHEHAEDVLYPELPPIAPLDDAKRCEGRVVGEVPVVPVANPVGPVAPC